MHALLSLSLRHIYGTHDRVEWRNGDHDDDDNDDENEEVSDDKRFWDSFFSFRFLVRRRRRCFCRSGEMMNLKLAWDERSGEKKILFTYDFLSSSASSLIWLKEGIDMEIEI